ncbi:MAG: OmpA family protein [Phycisphaerales bacterium JB059]
MTTRKKTATLLGVLCVGTLMAGGCKSVKKADYDAAIQENTKLRERVASLQDKVREANSQVDAAERAKQDALAQQRSAYESQLSAARQPAPVQSQYITPVNEVSGFEGIPGVETSVGGGGEIVVAVEGDVLFDSGKVDLKSSARRSLDRVASVIQSKYPGKTIRIEGYTDSDPIRKSKWRSNEHLSAERALAVEKYLVGKGVENDRVYSAAFGPANARATKKDSRRVEIVILGS